MQKSGFPKCAIMPGFRKSGHIYRGDGEPTSGEAIFKANGPN